MMTLKGEMTPHELLAKKLQSFDRVSPEEVRVLEQTLASVRAYDAGQEMTAAESRPGFSTLILEGWAARAKTLEDGARQITALHIPGDFVDLHSFLLHKMDHSVLALSPCRIVTAPHDRLRSITENHPHLARLLWLNTLVDAAIHRNWIVAMGRLSAAAQLAQLVCEMYVRLSVVGLAQDYEFDFPLTQSLAADALGLSPVHVNRVVRELRTQNLVNWRGRSVKILDWAALVAFAQFEPTYLSLLQEPR